MYHYAGNNPVKYTDPDGRDHGINHIGLGIKVLSVDPTDMDRTQARTWIRENILLDDSLPVCQVMYRLGMLGFKDSYDFSDNTTFTNAPASANNRANNNTKKQVLEGKIAPASTDLGTTSFNPWDDTDLFGAFGGGCGYTWNVESFDEKTRIAKVRIYFEDTFDFNEGNGERSEIAEKLTTLGRKARLSSFKVYGYYYLDVKVDKEAAKKIQEALNNAQ